MKSSTMKRLTLALGVMLASTAPLAIAQKEPAKAKHVSAATLKDLHTVPPMVVELEKRTFQWFWDSGNPTNGLIPDHYPSPSFASIASPRSTS